MYSGKSSTDSTPNPASPPADVTVPPPAGPQTSIPDPATRKDPAYTDGHAPNQVFHFQKWGISYGTADKGHAASILLSVAILALILVIVIVGAFLTNPVWLQETLKVLGNAFLIVAGIAVGKSASKED